MASVLSEASITCVADGLIDFGVPEEEARRYEGRIKSGHILVSVHTESPHKSNQAREIFFAAGAEDICTMTEARTLMNSMGNAYGASAAPFA
jgi:hypothetical protein